MCIALLACLAGHQGAENCSQGFTCAADVLFSCAAAPSALGCISAGKAEEPRPPVGKPMGAAAAPAEVVLLSPKPELVDGAKPDAAAPGAMLPRNPSRPASMGSGQSST